MRFRQFDKKIFNQAFISQWVFFLDSLLLIINTETCELSKDCLLNCQTVLSCVCVCVFIYHKRVKNFQEFVQKMQRKNVITHFQPIAVSVIRVCK